MDIVIIGSGNVAAVLGRKLFSTGHRILQVWGRKLPAARSLASELQADAITEKNQVSSHADFYLLAISDDALSGFVSSWSKQQGMVVHTAGSVSIYLLKSVSADYGIWYPLQSLRKELPAPVEIPMLIAASSTSNEKFLSDLCLSIGSPYEIADDEKRLKYHLAAVMVNNFSNHLFALAEEFCVKEQIDFALLLPLLQETVSRLKWGSPALSQTGPAMRNDTGTIEKHLQLLDSYPKLKKWYELFTRSIRDSTR